MPFDTLDGTSVSDLGQRLGHRLISWPRSSSSSFRSPFQSRIFFQIHFAFLVQLSVSNCCSLLLDLERPPDGGDHNNMHIQAFQHGVAGCASYGYSRQNKDAMNLLLFLAFLCFAATEKGLTAWLRYVPLLRGSFTDVSVQSTRNRRSHLDYIGTA